MVKRHSSSNWAFALTLLVLAMWELSGRSSPQVRLLLSTPLRVAQYSVTAAPELLEATLTTTLEATAGLLIATSTSLVLFILTLFYPRLLAWLMPAMVVSQVVPLVVLAPFFVIALGIGVPSKIAMAALLCFFPSFIGLAQGYRLISPTIHELLDVYNAPTRVRVLRVYLPLVTPQAMAGLKVSATLSVIGAIVAEFTGSEVGLGRNLFLSTIRLQPDLMVASLGASALLGAALFMVVRQIETVVGHWYLEAHH